MLSRIFIITLGFGAAILPCSVADVPPETPAAKPLSVQHLRLNLETGRVETVAPAAVEKTVAGDETARPEARVQKERQKTVRGGGAPIRASVFAPGEPIEPSAGLIPEIRVANIVNVANTTDPDSDGYYLEFDFDVAIDANIQAGYYTYVAAIIICETTGQEWPTTPWLIIGENIDWVWIHFDESDFAGHIEGNTDLDFTVELYNMNRTTLYDTETTLGFEPFKADTDVPTLAAAKLYNVANLVDADTDSYYEEFDFDIGINAHVGTGSVPVRAKVLCPTTGQTWQTGSWTAVSGQDNWADVPFDETDFAGRIGLNTLLDFTVEIYDTSFVTKWGETTDVKDEPFPADIPQPPPYISAAKIYNVSNLQDPDSDGHFSRFQFDIGITAAVTMGMVTVRAKILCPATGQVFVSTPWAVSPSAPFWKDVPFDQLSFAQSEIPFGHVALDFTIELWDSTLTTRYDTETTVTGEPFPIEPYRSAAESEWTLY